MKTIIRLLAIAGWIAAIIALLTLNREAFGWLIGWSTLAFACYLALHRLQIDFKTCLWLGVGMRVLAVFCFPNLSDDLYRFLWDGTLILDGINPYLSTPAEIVANGSLQHSYSQLYNSLNSPDYYSVYPPLNQLIFAFAALGMPQLYAASIVLKLPLLFAELISLWFITRLLVAKGVDRRNLGLYALNPLIILELLGNAHFEALTICFMLMALFYLTQTLTLRAGLAMGLAVGAKLLPLLMVPFLVKAIPKSERKRFLLAFASTTLLAMAPLLQPEVFNHFFDSIDLYFRSFEFNASIYYLARWVGIQVSGYNMIAWIGPGLSAFFLGIAATMLYRAKQETLHFHLYWLFLIYFLFATTIHPWYICPLVALAVINQKVSAIVWSFVVLLSYAAYTSSPVFENPWLLLLEYGLLAAAIFWDLKNSTQRVSAVRQ